ncbi:hypothetical protein K431DRAFT_282023 [Polychaeton citri CBS 116435]|uniref:Uncharacterized protein n=1 Tax=Polychaeton citri CBS 116435 TaxID=1314669 RepID=A0A9P4QE73_9PEZI|nr:hypothetical protein K431DRAFT_282023 [Polychaeton citri CBS 116435]
MTSVDGKYNEHTHSSASSSQLSTFESETDEFGRKLLQHGREQRYKMAVAKGDIQPQPFRKARPRLSDRLKRENAQANGHGETDDSIRQYQEHHTGVDVASAVVAPREWGRRAKKQTDWMRRIQHPSEDGDVKPEFDEIDQDGDRDAIIPRRTAYTGDLEYVQTIPDQPLHSIETTPPSLQNRRHHSSPSSLHHMNTSIHLDSSLADQDFGSASLLASTPATTKYHSARKIDELTKREIQTLELQGVATKNLDHISGRSPNSTLRRRRSSQFPEVNLGTVKSETRLVTAPDGAARSRIPRRQSLIINKENVSPGAEATAAGFKSTQTVALTDKPAEGAVNVNGFSRPGHRRNDSMKLLKRLARVSSMSPSPQAQRQTSPPEARPHTVTRQMRDRNEARVVDETSRHGVFDAQELGRSSKEPLKRQSAIEASKQDEPRLTNGNANDGAYGEDFSLEVHRSKPFASEAEKMDVKMDVKTPVVTGAWMDTPNVIDQLGEQAHKHRSSSLKSGKTIEEGSDDAEWRSAKSKSALSDLLQENRDLTNPQYGDSTLASLENIINPDADLTDVSLAQELDNIAKDAAMSLDKDRAWTQAEKERRQESLTMEEMNKHLRAARTSVKDANKNLRRVENRFEEPGVTSTKALLDTSSQPNHLLKREKHGKILCPTCGYKGYENVWRALWTELMEQFYVRDPSSQLPKPFQIRFTWLGLFSLLCIGWFVSETTLCSFFCHPMEAITMEGYGVNPDAPRFPFVIPTLFFRPTRWLWKPLFDAFAAILSLMWQEMFGENAAATASAGGRSEVASRGDATKKAFKEVTRDNWSSETTASIAAGATRVAQSLVDAIDEVGSMWDDHVVL